VALVNESMVARLWSGAAPSDVVGRSVSLDGTTFQVIGVVADYRLHRFGEAPPSTAYVAFWQNAFEPQIDARLAIRVDGDPARAMPALRRAASSVDPAVPVTEAITMPTQMRASFFEVRLGGSVLLASAALALFLSAVGLYGVVSFLVSQRSREIGIRLAIGARPADVVRQVVRQGLRPIWMGGAIGLVASLAVTPLLSRWLFGVAPLDLPTIAVALIAVAGVAIVAAFVPARHAAGTDPARAFRCE
jgi:hypothetical protein